MIYSWIDILLIALPVLGLLFIFAGVRRGRHAPDSPPGHRYRRWGSIGFGCLLLCSTYPVYWSAFHVPPPASQVKTLQTPLSHLLEELNSETSGIIAVRELTRRIEEDEITEAEMPDVIEAVTLAFTNNELDKRLSPEMLIGGLALLSKGKLNQQHKEDLLRGFEIQPIKCRYDSVNKELHLTGLTEFPPATGVSQMICRREVEVLSIDGQQINARIIDDFSPLGRWGISSLKELPVNPSENMNVRVRSSWYDLSSESAAKAFWSSPAAKTKTISQTPMVAYNDECTLHKSDYLQTLHNVYYWSAEAVNKQRNTAQ